MPGFLRSCFQARPAGEERGLVGGKFGGLRLARAPSSFSWMASKLKEAGRSKQLLELRTYFLMVLYSVHTRPGQLQWNKKTRLTGRVTASRYFEYLLILYH
jgi:hypothetical protein